MTEHIPIIPLITDVIEMPSWGIISIKKVLLKIINIISFESKFKLYMKTHLLSILFFLLLLISCGGSKSDINDSSLSGNYNQNTNNKQVNNTQGNNSSNQTPAYSFGNELVWSDEFDEDSSFGTPAVSPDKWNTETVAPDNGSSVSYTHLTLPTILLV